MPEVVYRADLSKQTSQYERRIRSLEELRVRQENECRQENSRRESKLNRLSKRLHRCELERARHISDQLLRENSGATKKTGGTVTRLERIFSELSSAMPLVTQSYPKFVLSADPWFEPASITLSDGAKPWLEKLASVLETERELRVTIGAHSDAIGTPKENWNLTAGQAIAVAVYLIEMGADPARVEIAAFGRYTPRASNDTREGRSENRRIQFVFSSVQSQSSHGTKNVEGD